MRNRVAELEQSRLAGEQLAAIAAHELLKPLIMVEACANLVASLLREGRQDTVESDLRALARSAGDARLLAETLLLHARASDEDVQLEPVPLDSLVHRCAGMLRHEIAEARATIVIGRLPVVAADAVLLAGVFRNLLANALEYGPRHDGVIRVSARRRRSAWRISVVSEGPAVPREDRDRIFEPLRRGCAERRSAGAGLGLALCRSVVERHGGRIGVEPCADGNRFYFTIPDA